MINTAAQAAEVVQHGKFPPLGARGYNVRSRGVQYGLQAREAAFPAANARTHMFAQIETVEAIANFKEICAVEGLSGIFIGPGDLSVSFGCTALLGDARLISAVCTCVRHARAYGLHAGILAPPGPLLAAAMDAGCDLLFYGSDIADLASAWPNLLTSVDLSEDASPDGTKRRMGANPQTREDPKPPRPRPAADVGQLPGDQ
jgi:4-hydroxy-2-oxoheptanedioate aldolase